MSAFRTPASSPLPAFQSPTFASPAPSALCILVDSCTMRAMRVALPVLVRSVLPVLSRSSARAPSRLVSTEAAAEGSIAPKPGRVAISRGDRLVKEMTPVATFLGIVVTIGAIGAYYSSRLAALEERMAGTASTLKSDLLGIIKEVDAKNTGTKDAVTKEVDAKIAGSEKAVAKEIAGFKEAADLKVRSRSTPDPRSRVHTLPTLSLTCLPLSLAVQDQVTRSSPSSPSPSPSPSPSSSSGAALAALVAVQKQR